ncbi:hypothetical protein LNP25_13595 [Klebsiella variicola subsp. variicola]|nr:hypothetical protein [Klebsiella variicola subsp. variicola]
MGLKHLIEKLEPHFTHGGQAEKYYPLYEAAATIFYTPGQVTSAARRTCARRHRPQADDDPCGLPYSWRCSGACSNAGLQTIPALHKLYGAEQLQQVIANNWHYSVAQWLGSASALTPAG